MELILTYSVLNCSFLMVLCCIGVNFNLSTKNVPLRPMQIEILKSKIHRVKITEANLHYIGSITIDEDLMEAANIIENEKVQVLDIDNGERLETYVIRGTRGSGMICMNGPAARRINVGDTVIVISYAQMDFEQAKKFKPTIIFPKDDNSL
jgi:aspartate 1-decarboxylase